MRGEERRAAIVQAAIHLFAEKGFRGTTTRGLAAALGVSGPVLYRHFKTKRDLYRAIIETKAQQRDRQLAGLTALRDAGDHAFFQYLGHRILERYDDDPDFMRLLLFSALERHELADLFFERQIQEHLRAVTAYIQRRIDEGRYRPVDAQAAASGFNGMLNYYGMMRMLFGRRIAEKSRAEVVEEMVEIFLRGILAP